FTQGDMSYFAGGNNDFPVTGRVQSNGNLFVTAGGTLTFHNPVRAAGDVIRDQLPNGVLASSNWTGQVLVPQVASGCDGAPPASSGSACRPLKLTPAAEQSADGGPIGYNGGAGTADAQWQAISQQTYNGMILSGSTGAQKLTFPTSDPIQMIRRPPLSLPCESPASLTGSSRLYNQAQIRVLLADTPAELSPCGQNGLNDPQNIRLANFDDGSVIPGGPNFQNGVPVGVA